MPVVIVPKYKKGNALPGCCQKNAKKEGDDTKLEGDKKNPGVFLMKSALHRVEIAQ